MDYNNKSICKPHHVANLWGQQSGGVVGSPRALPFTMLSNSDSTSVMGSEKDEFRSYERKRERREREIVYNCRRTVTMATHQVLDIGRIQLIRERVQILRPVVLLRTRYMYY